jgi:hypothetical protein
LDLKASSLFGLSNVAFGVGEVLNLIVPGATGATSTSCSSAGGDDIDVALPPDAFSAIEHVPGTDQAGRFWLFEPISPSFLDAHIGLSAELPNFTKPNGTPLLAQYNENGLGFVLEAARDFNTGESLSVSGGQILTWPAVTLREMPADFGLDELTQRGSRCTPAWHRWRTLPSTLWSPSRRPRRSA